MVLAGLLFWWPGARELHVGSDDRDMMAVSRQIAAGEWIRLLTPQADHLVPLFRLVRLPFDLRFPNGFSWLYALCLAAHGTSVILLYRLSERYLGRRGALTAAVLFGWNGLGAEALVIKSQNTYVFSLTLVLAALALLLASRPLACALALLAALAFDTTPVLATTPGLLLAWRLLYPSLPAAVAGAACLAPAVTGGLAWWMLTGAAAPTVFHTGVAARLWDGLYGTALHYAFLIRHAPPEPWLPAAAAVALAILLYVVPSRRWVLVTLALCLVPTWVTLTARGSGGYQTSRYCYTGILAVAVCAGALIGMPRLGRLPLLLLLALAPLYYWNQYAILHRKLALLRFAPSTTREFWISWKSWFERAGWSRVPAIEIEPRLRLDEIFALLYPLGKRDVAVLPPGQETPEDCVTLEERLLFFSGPPLPPHPRCGTGMAKHKGGIDVRASGNGRGGGVHGDVLACFLPNRPPSSAYGNRRVVLGGGQRAIRGRRLREDPGALRKADGRGEPVQIASRHLAPGVAGRDGSGLPRTGRRL